VLSIRIDRLCLVATMDAAANRYFCTEAVMQENSKSLLSYIYRTPACGVPVDPIIAMENNDMLKMKSLEVVIVRH
jgi:hypothetical protein